MTLIVPQPFDEADIRRVQVEQAKVDAAGAEAVLDVRRHRQERAGAGTVPLAVLEELELALEHVERVGVVGVGVRVDALEVRPVRELERLDVRQLGEDAVVPDALALARSREERLLQRPGSLRTSKCARTAPTPPSTRGPDPRRPARRPA